MGSQRVPRGESVLLGDCALRIAQTAKTWLTPEQFLGLTFELIEIGPQGKD